MEPPKPGLYPGVPFDEYTRWNAVNHSTLRHFDKTPAHARWHMLHPEPSSKYQELGHAIHAALLEPARFEVEYVVAPDVDRRTKVGKAEWADFEAKHKGASFIMESEMEVLRAIQSNAAQHETIKQVLYGLGVNELSLVWVDPETGMLCKARIDRLTSLDGPLIVDLKSTHAPASTHGWQMAVEKYKLHQQAAHYRNGLNVLRPLPEGQTRKYAWLVVETEFPGAVRIFEAEDAALDIGRDQVAAHLRAYKECMETGSWPAWPQGMDIAGLPPWVYKRFDLE